MSVCDNSAFLSKFYEPAILKNADPKQGKPALITAILDDNPVIIKHWPKEGGEVSDILEDIWLYEIRQLRRLKGYPGIGDYIANLIDTGRDEYGFYLVLDVGKRLPLSHFLQKTAQLTLAPRWLRKLDVPQKRIHFWHNIIRVINALQLLHSQGLLHRHLDEDAILTNPSSPDFDFQLTGFEWSVRVQTMSVSAHFNSPSEFNKSGGVYSFLTDWADLGALIARILKLDYSALTTLDRPITELVEETGLTIDEVTLIRGLLGVVKLQPNMPREGMNGGVVTIQVQDIIKSLKSLTSFEDTHLDLLIYLNTHTSNIQSPTKKISVFRAIQSVFKDLYDVTLGEDDSDECIKFVAEDLRNAPRVIILPSSEDRDEELLLLGTRLTYILTKNQDVRSSTSSWDAAFCHSAYIEPPGKLINSSEPAHLGGYNLRCYLPSEYKSQQKNNTRSWDDVIIGMPSYQEEDVKKQNILDGFAAYHLTEIAYAKSENYPVSLLSFERNNNDYSIHNVVLKSRSDHDTQNLSRSLGLKPPAERLDEQLDGEKGNFLSWILVSNTNFNDQEEIVLEFQKKVTQEDGENVYSFTTTSQSPDYSQYFLIPLAVQGTISQLNRRAAAIDALGDHAELLGMLANPYVGSSQLQDEWERHQAFSLLDASKQDAFSNVMKTLPLYLVQGPPGVGKTFLVTALIQQIFSQETESRVLLTAQSHSTVQHLYHEVMKNFGGSIIDENGPLVVSCIKTKGQNDSESDSLSEMDLQAQNYIQSLIDSPLFEQAVSESAKEKIITMGNNNARAARYSLISQLLKAANIVFATTNSRQVEELIRARSQFDWSVMEETGKVTGIELLSPLLLSYRRLMIGDHKQLPPYAAEDMRRILMDSDQLHSALKFGTDIFNNAVKGQLIKNRFTEEYVQSLTVDQLNNMSREALRLHLLFESLIIEEEKALEKSVRHFGSAVRHRPIASMLSIQHRMHPDISELVSNVFYNDKLSTENEKAAYYRQVPSIRPFNLNGIDSAPAIVWVETPDKQANRYCSAGDTYPRWKNSYESSVVMEVLSTLTISKSADKKPKLAVLSPYAQQVKLLTREMEKLIANNKLDNLRGFECPDDHASFCSTVDGFQGAEADIIIISLVRNNHHSYALSALGFLLDSRRMNVLLSRAKYQMIIVGSFQFLQHWAQKIEREQVGRGDNTYKFIVNLVTNLSKLKAQGVMKCIPSESFVSDKLESEKTKSKNGKKKSKYNTGSKL